MKNQNEQDRNYNLLLIIGVKAQREWQKPNTLWVQDFQNSSKIEKTKIKYYWSTNYNKFEMDRTMLYRNYIFKIKYIVILITFFV